MSYETPDLKEFCFDPNAPFGPDMMLAIWAKTYLNQAEFKEFKRLIHEIAADHGPGGQSTVEQMIGIIEMARFIAG